MKSGPECQYRKVQRETPQEVEVEAQEAQKTDGEDGVQKEAKDRHKDSSETEKVWMGRRNRQTGISEGSSPAQTASW